MIRKVFLWILKVVIKGLLSLRYKIEVRNPDILKDPRLKERGVLVLPNHTSEIESFILLNVLGVDFELKPLVTEQFYYYPLAKFFMRLVRAKPVVDFDSAVNEFKLKSAEKLFNDVVEDLKAGGRILLYPAAQLKTTGEERIGGRSLAHSTMKRAPDTEIVLVRISGLWGSLFSKVYTEETPDFWTLLGKCSWILIKNLFFFAPRRKVVIEFAFPPEGFPLKGGKVEFNRALERFYNQYSDKEGKIVEKEPVNQVPYYFWSKKVPQVYKRSVRKKVDLELQVPKNIRQDLLYQLSEMSDKSVKEIQDDDDLVHDVGLDSLNIAGLYSYIETHYEIDPNLLPVDLKTVHDLFAAAMHVKEKKKEGKKYDFTSSWTNKADRPAAEFAEGKTIIEMFLNIADRMKHHSAVTDAVVGEMDYLTMRRSVIILAKKIEELEGNYIGVMLPSSVGAYIVTLAIMLAGKVPVPLNWTIGRFFTNHALDLLEIKHVISSAKFLNRIDNVDIGSAIDKLLLIEDIRKKITLTDKIKGALLAKLSGKRILKRFPAARKTEDDLAVALFTSGTTALPKCVPLTHKNIITNQKSSLASFDLHSEDTLIMVLPPFHIFGFNIGILPLIMGIRVVYSPDPLDGNTIAKEILKWRVTVIFMAPTFYAHLFRVANISQLKSIRLFISGAEAASASLMEYIQKLGDVWFLEGYGLTETAPVIAVNHIGDRGKGVGKILPCLDLIVIDSDSMQKLAVNQVGEICVAGDSVFNGYYKHDNSKVFMELDGRKYFRTGDLGHYDEKGYLYLGGRLKNTIKKGGELINLAAIEAALFIKAKEKGWIGQDVNQSPFACVPKESAQGSPKAVLFTEVSIPLDRINAALIEAGFSRLYKINEVHVIDQIPMLKTGKTCYRKLFDILNNTVEQK